MKVFISGGSRGIGRSIVEAFLFAGHDVAFSYLTGKKEAEEILASASVKFPHQKIRAYAMDITKSADVDAVGEKVLEDFGEVQALVCNAGLVINGLVVTQSDEDWSSVLQTNLTGSFYLTRFFLQHFLENRYGRIVLLSSVARRGAAGLAAYAASKAGLLGLGLSIAKEYGAKGITCNLVSPGYIETEMTQNSATQRSSEFWLSHCPARRAGTGEEVAHSVLHLCSPESAFVNGAELTVSGGLDELL